MTALKAFANLINMNMANLAATYAQQLVKQDAAYERFSAHQRQATARKLLRAVTVACTTQSAAPLTRLFSPTTNGRPPRWAGSLKPPRPLAEVVALGQTLSPLATRAETHDFLEAILAATRNVVQAHNGATPPLDFPPSTTLKPLPPDSTAAAAPLDISQPSIAKLAQIDLTVNSRLVDLPTYAFQVEAGAIVHEVEKVLRQHIILPGVIITDQREAIGVISRRKFYEKLGQLYGIAVYLRRPIRLMLKDLSEPLRLPATTAIPDALQAALDRLPHFVYEPIVIESTDHTYRLLDVYTLLMAQSRLFANLQYKLQQANTELEARVEQRTAELVQMNEELKITRDEALAASRFKSELLAKVSHELRTPLGAILGFTEMMQVGVYGPISPEQNEVSGKIIDSANYLTRMVNQLLDQARFDADRLELEVGRLFPAQLVQDTVSKLSLAAEKKGLQLTTDIAADLPPNLNGDPVRVQQILVNLVSNAIKFTEQGRVHIRLFCPDAERWAIQVSDTGPGIPAEAQERIFEPFGQVDGSITRQHGGTGLGLSIVKQLTGLMRGEIDLDSELSQGSTFTITLPLSPIQEEVA